MFAVTLNKGRAYDVRRNPISHRGGVLCFWVNTFDSEQFSKSEEIGHSIIFWSYPGKNEVSSQIISMLFLW